MLLSFIFCHLALVRDSRSQTFTPFRARQGLVDSQEQEVRAKSLAMCAGVSAAKTRAGQLFEGFLFSETNSTCRAANFAPDFEGAPGLAESIEAYRISSKDRPWGTFGAESSLCFVVRYR